MAALPAGWDVCAGVAAGWPALGCAISLWGLLRRSRSNDKKVEFVTAARLLSERGVNPRVSRKAQSTMHCVRNGPRECMYQPVYWRQVDMRLFDRMVWNANTVLLPLCKVLKCWENIFRCRSEAGAAQFLTAAEQVCPETEKPPSPPPLPQLCKRKCHRPKCCHMHAKLLTSAGHTLNRTLASRAAVFQVSRDCNHGPHRRGQPLFAKPSTASTRAAAMVCNAVRRCFDVCSTYTW